MKLEISSLILADQNSKSSLNDTPSNVANVNDLILLDDVTPNRSGNDTPRDPEAIKVSKQFAIYENKEIMEPLRKALLNRGWTETFNKDDESPSFIWFGKMSKEMKVVFNGSSTINVLKQQPLKDFSQKDILLDYARKVNLQHTNSEQKINVPRTYKLFENERNEFVEDYYFTACSSFIRFINAHGSLVFSKTGKIDKKWIDYAMNKLKIAIQCCNQPKDKVNLVVNDRNSEFQKFKKIYQSVVKYQSKIKIENCSVEVYLKKCKRICERSKQIWPNFENDGFYNLWLLKPARRSAGFGIKLFDDNTDMLNFAKINEGMKYLVQKYIERPLLVYKTKFDLRQYFLIVHHESSVRIWMYKQFYLKFSSKLYNPLNFNVSVHITNTAIQRKFCIDKQRSKEIPTCNEWSSFQFFRYLEKYNKKHLWHTKIDPIIKQNIITIVSESIDLSMIQPNRFQLFGCDFMINDRYEPILLEINGFPTLTSVICSMCMEDVVKVVVDTKEMPTANTGHFEMILDKNIEESEPVTNP